MKYFPFLLITFLIFFSNTNISKCQIVPETIVINKYYNKFKGFKIGKVNINNEIKSELRNYIRIKDTIAFLDNKIDLVTIEANDITFKLKIHRDSAISMCENKYVLYIESKIPPYPLCEYKLDTLVNDEIQNISKILRIKTYDSNNLRQSYQTCISYAIEAIFLSNGINPEPFFFRRSMVYDFSDLENILNKFFIKIETINQIRKKALKKSEHLNDDQVILLFRNYYGEPIHACFNLYGRTWTKNGMEPYMSFSQPYPVIETYQQASPSEHSYKSANVKSIEIYKLNSLLFQ